MVARDTVWPAGTPCWADVSADDLPKAIDFYAGLFGWDIQAGGPEVGGYSICHQDGRIVAAVGPKMGRPDQPSMWMTYLATDDADDTAARIKAAGGQVVQEPMDVMDQGRMAVALDSAGMVFGLWQGRLTTGIGLANEPGALTWNEQLSGDFEGSKAFYREVFGFGYQDMSGEGFSYAMIQLDGNTVGGIGGEPQDMPGGWASYFAVADTDACVARLTGLGGSVIRPSWDTEYGRMAIVADAEGAVFGLVGMVAPEEE